jgi:hypothetical protein
MRHNFLPTKDQDVLKRVYYVHAMIVALFLLSVVGLVGLGSLFPAYISTNTEERSQLNTVASLKQSNDTSEALKIQKDLQDDSAKVTVLSKAINVVRPSAIITRMVEVRGPVRISSIVLSDISTSTAVVVMQGVAPTRESLVDFKTRLERLSIGNKVELPISGFAQSKDLPFSLRVNHKLP